MYPSHSIYQPLVSRRGKHAEEVKQAAQGADSSSGPAILLSRLSQVSCLSRRIKLSAFQQRKIAVVASCTCLLVSAGPSEMAVSVLSLEKGGEMEKQI